MRKIVLAILLLLTAWAPALAAPEIITLPNTPPERSADKHPTASALLQTWLDGYGWEEGKRFDQQRYEILDDRVQWNEFGRAFLQFRILPLTGDPVDYAASVCPGRTRPLELQVYFQWTAEDINRWTGLAGRGGDASKPCGDEPLWTADQVEKIVNPPPLPVPPRVTRADVVTPKSGSPLRKAILDGLRPMFEADFGAPVLFKVNEMREAAGFAHVVVHPQRPGGKEIDDKTWTEVTGGCEVGFEDASAEFWMRLRNGTWEVGWSNAYCPTDSIAYHGYLIGAPPQIVDLDEWGGRDYMPVDDPQYFRLWW
jgi:hypothetical protein